MKPTGPVRNLDGLGRITVPIEARRLLGIANGDPIEFLVTEDSIVLRAYRPGCRVPGCGVAEELVELAPGWHVCERHLGQGAEDGGEGR